MSNVETGKFVSLITAPGPLADPDSLWFVYQQSELLLLQYDPGLQGIPSHGQLRNLGLEPVRANYLGRLAGRDCFAAEIHGDITLPPRVTVHGLRAAYGVIEDDLFAIAGRAFQIVDWDRNHQFCGRCGQPTEAAPDERAKRCLACGLTSYPRVSPAVIVLIERDGKALLARGSNFANPFYNCLAGFVEPGESLEATVKREVREEAGIEVGQIRYFGSQPWPFPHSLMIGFTAVYAGGDLVLAADEIADAGWYGPDELPRVPAPLSIARQLIDDFVRRHGGSFDQPGLRAWRT